MDLWQHVGQAGNLLRWLKDCTPSKIRSPCVERAIWFAGQKYKLEILTWTFQQTWSDRLLQEGKTVEERIRLCFNKDWSSPSHMRSDFIYILIEKINKPWDSRKMCLICTCLRLRKWFELIHFFQIPLRLRAHLQTRRPLQKGNQLPVMSMQLIN